VWASGHSALGALATLVVVVTIAPAGASATVATGADLARLDASRAWLARNQTLDGGLPFTGVRGDLFRTHAWGVLGLAAANVDARLLARTGGRALFTVIENQASMIGDTEDYARFALAAHAIGADPRATGGVNLIDDGVLTGQLDSGAFAARRGATQPDVTATASAALALSTIGGQPVPRQAADTAVDWLLTVQNPDGSWPTGPPGGPDDVATTTLALEALATLRGFTSPSASATLARNRALSWLQLAQNADGGFGDTPGAPSATIPTAAACRALVAVGVDPHALVSSGGKAPMQFLAAAQNAATGEVAEVPGGPRAAQPTQTTAAAMLAFAAVTLPFQRSGAGPIDLPEQPIPAGLPSGPLLPNVTPAPAVPTRPSPPAPTPVAALPTIQPPATAPAGNDAGNGVTKIKPTKKRRAPDDGYGGEGLAGAGAGSGGGGGTVATPGAAARGGGGGGVSPGPVSAAAPSVAGASAPLPSRRVGGTRTRTKDSAPRSVEGTLIGRQSATEGARGSSTAAPGAAGARAGGHATPWWAIALALTIVAGMLTGVRLDRRSPELAL
jgi:hypothetical protein